MREPTRAESKNRVRPDAARVGRARQGAGWYWRDWEQRKAEIEWRNSQLTETPPWPRPWFLSDELEQVVARELSERPMHGVPSTYREDIVDRFAGINSITADIGDMPFIRAATLTNRIQPCADIIGEYTSRLRGKVRDIAIEDILQACAETTLECGNQPRAWLRAVCAERFGYTRSFP